MPVTMPVALTVATDMGVLLHVPPPVTSVSAVAEPTHAIGMPVIAATAGPGSTVTIRVAAIVPQLFVTV